MKSIGFPKMLNKNTTNIIEDSSAIMHNIKSLLKSEHGEFIDDPYFGVSLKSFLFDQNSTILRDVLIDNIYTQLALFMPQLRVSRKDIKVIQKDNTLYATITATNLLDYTTDMYNIVLFQEGNKND